MNVISSYMINGKGKSMDKVRRVERMVAMTKLLVDSPQKLIPLNYFCLHLSHIPYKTVFLLSNSNLCSLCKCF